MLSDSKILAPLSRDTLTQQATDTIRRFILLEALDVGEALPNERELCDALCISRTILREALSVLVAEGWITKKQGSGIFVAAGQSMQRMPSVKLTVDTSGQDLQALREARFVVEVGAAELLVQRITAEDIQQLKAINEALSENIQLQRSTQKNDADFHSLLLQATRNEIVTGFIPLVVEYFRLQSYYQPQTIRYNPESIPAEHNALIEALQARDAAALRAALLTHDRTGRLSKLENSRPISTPRVEGR